MILAGLMLVFVMGAIASTLAVWKAISHLDVEQETFHAGGRTVNIAIYKFAYVPAVIASLSMLVMMMATLTWSIMVYSALPQVFSGNYGLWQTNTQPWVYGILVVMVVCSLASLLGVARGRSALVET